jgi:predicted Fe-Mo cluster-binding NifX family protein
MILASGNLRVAIPTGEDGGLEDNVSDVFGRAETFTIIDIQGGEVVGVEVLRNPAVAYKHGAGPIVVKTLIDRGVNMILAGEIGPGAESLLEHHDIERVRVKPETRVAESIKDALSKLEG